MIIIFLKCSKMATDLLENFHIFLAKNLIFQRIFNQKIYGWLEGMEDGIIPAILLPQLERRPSGLPFSYSLYGVLFLVCSKMATDLLENFHIFLAKNLIFQRIFIKKIYIFKANFHSTISFQMRLYC